MSYALIDAEVTALADVTLEESQDGIALLLRHRGRPIHYSLHGFDAGSRIAAAQLWELVGKYAGADLLAQAIRDELAPAPPPRPLSITAAICTHARTDLLARCLESLLKAKATGPDSVHLDVLVVDNNPPDDSTRQLVASFETVRYALEPRPGLDFGRNRAVAEGGGEYLAFLDDDVVVDSRWLHGLSEALSENPDAGAVTGLVLPAELVTKAQIDFERRGGFRRGTRKLRYHGDTQPGNALYPTGAGIFGAGCNMVLRRELVQKLGGFDEALDTGPPLPGGGDLDIFYRVVRSGEPLVYEPRMLVFHRHRPDHQALRRQYWSWGDGFMAYVAKTYGTDIAARPKLRALVLWWSRYALRQVAAGVKRRDRESIDLAVAELVGGVTGLGGSYGRSRKRTQEIRDAHA